MSYLREHLLPIVVSIALVAAIFGAKYVQAAWLVDKEPPSTTSITAYCGGTNVPDDGDCNTAQADIWITCSDSPAVDFSGCYRIHYSLDNGSTYTTCQAVTEETMSSGPCRPLQAELTQTYTHNFTLLTTQGNVDLVACSTDGAGNKEWVDTDSDNVPKSGEVVDNCATFSFKFTGVGSWWQVEDSDVMASGGGIQSIIPKKCTGTCQPYLDLEGGGGYPGVTAYGSGTANFGLNGQVAKMINERWLANSGYAGRKYDFNYFFKFAPKAGTGDSDMKVVDCTGGCEIPGGQLESEGASDKVKFVHYKNGNLTIKTQGAGFTNKKLFIFVDGNLNLEKNITIKKGEGFFGAAVKGNINISRDVYDNNKNKPALEGLFMADGVINTGTKQPGSDDSFLYVRGSLIGWGGINFQRNLGDTDNEKYPGEKIEYAPDLLFNFPRQLLREGIVWREISP